MAAPLLWHNDYWAGGLTDSGGGTTFAAAEAAGGPAAAAPAFRQPFTSVDEALAVLEAAVAQLPPLVLPPLVLPPMRTDAPAPPHSQLPAWEISCDSPLQPSPRTVTTYPPSLLQSQQQQQQQSGGVGPEATRGQQLRHPAAVAAGGSRSSSGEAAAGGEPPRWGAVSSAGMGMGRMGMDATATGNNFAAAAAACMAGGCEPAGDCAGGALASTALQCAATAASYRSQPAAAASRATQRATGAAAVAPPRTFITCPPALGAAAASCPDFSAMTDAALTAAAAAGTSAASTAGGSGDCCVAGGDAPPPPLQLQRQQQLAATLLQAGRHTYSGVPHNNSSAASGSCGPRLPWAQPGRQQGCWDATATRFTDTYSGCDQQPAAVHSSGARRQPQPQQPQQRQQAGVAPAAAAAADEMVAAAATHDGIATTPAATAAVDAAAVSEGQSPDTRQQQGQQQGQPPMQQQGPQHIAVPQPAQPLAGAADPVSGVRCITCRVEWPSARWGFFARGTGAFTCRGCCLRNLHSHGFYGPTGTQSLEEAGGRECAECGREETDRWWPHLSRVGAYVCSLCITKHRSKRARQADADAEPDPQDKGGDGGGVVDTSQEKGGDGDGDHLQQPEGLQERQPQGQRQGLQQVQKQRQQHTAALLPAQTLDGQLGSSGIRCATCRACYERRPGNPNGFFARGTGAFTCRGCCIRNLHSHGFYGPPGTGSLEEAGGRECAECGMNGPTSWRLHSSRVGAYVCTACIWTLRNKGAWQANAGAKPDLHDKGGDGDGAGDGDHLQQPEPAPAVHANGSSSSSHLARQSTTAPPQPSHLEGEEEEEEEAMRAHTQQAPSGPGVPQQPVPPPPALLPAVPAAPAEVGSSGLVTALAAPGPSPGGDGTGAQAQACGAALGAAPAATNSAAVACGKEETESAIAAVVPPPTSSGGGGSQAPLAGAGGGDSGGARQPAADQVQCAADQVQCAACGAPVERRSNAPSGIFAWGAGAFTCHSCCQENRRSRGFYGPPGTRSLEEAGGRECAECGAEEVCRWCPHPTQTGVYCCDSCWHSLRRRAVKRVRCSQQEQREDGETAAEADADAPGYTDSPPSSTAAAARGSEGPGIAGASSPAAAGAAGGWVSEAAAPQQPAAASAQGQAVGAPPSSPQAQITCASCGAPYVRRPRTASGFFARGTLAYTCHDCCRRNTVSHGFYGPPGTRSLEEAGGRECVECGTEQTRRWHLHPSHIGAHACPDPVRLQQQPWHLPPPQQQQPSLVLMDQPAAVGAERAADADAWAHNPHSHPHHRQALLVAGMPVATTAAAATTGHSIEPHQQDHNKQQQQQPQRRNDSKAALAPPSATLPVASVEWSDWSQLPASVAGQRGIAAEQQQQQQQQQVVTCAACAATVVLRAGAPSGFFARGTGAYTCRGCCLKNRQSHGFYGPPGTRSLEEAGGRECAECSTQETQHWCTHPTRVGAYSCSRCTRRLQLR